MSYDNEVKCPACKATGLNELGVDGWVYCECGECLFENERDNEVDK
jgi:hypothetical protein